MINSLPKVRGRYRFNVPMKKISWMGVGGEAEILYKPHDRQDLHFFLKELPKDISLNIIGGTSNLLISDNGLEGVTIKLGSEFNQIYVDGEYIDVGAACLDGVLAKTALEFGLSGFEFLAGIPGTIGGAIRMNAGAFDSEIKDILISIYALDFKGNFMEIPRKMIDFKYRGSNLPRDLIFLGAKFKGKKEVYKKIEKKMEQLLEQKESSQPLRVKTGGSTFKNPTQHKAWELIEAVGARGMKIGGAQISEKHCNFIINLGKASSKDIETLGKNVHKKVLDAFGINLDWEIIFLGS